MGKMDTLFESLTATTAATVTAFAATANALAATAVAATGVAATEVANHSGLLPARYGWQPHSSTSQLRDVQSIINNAKLFV